MSQHEITRTVAIEHAGEKIQIEVHVHLTAEEIERIVLPAVLKSLSRQMRMMGGARFTADPATPRVTTLRDGPGEYRVGTGPSAFLGDPMPEEGKG